MGREGRRNGYVAMPPSFDTILMALLLNMAALRAGWPDIAERSFSMMPGLPRLFQHDDITDSMPHFMINFHFTQLLLGQGASARRPSNGFIYRRRMCSGIFTRRLAGRRHSYLLLKFSPRHGAGD